MSEAPKPGPAIGDQNRRFEDYALWGFSVAAGTFIWFASERLTGKREPWDAGGSYVLYLFAVGIVAGLMRPRRRWLCPLGVMLGQDIGLLGQSRWGSLAPLGLVFAVPITSFISLVGALIGGLVGVLGRKLVAGRHESTQRGRVTGAPRHFP